MKALLLVGTLKDKEVSNTAVLAEFVAGYLKKEEIEHEMVLLTQYNILPGTLIKQDTPDDFPAIYEKILEADILFFATPIWWGNHSSEIQRIIERLDEIHDLLMEGKESPLEGKLGGMIITGDSDGAEHVTGNIANFFNGIGITLPAYSSLSVLWEGHAKKKKNTKAALMKYYEKEYAQDAETLARSLARFLQTAKQ